MNRFLIVQLVSFLIAYSGSAQDDLYQRFYDGITQGENRLPGSKGIAQAEEKLRKIFKEHDLELHAQTYDTEVPSTTICSLKVGGKIIKGVYPLAPNVLALSTTNGKVLKGDLLYVGDGNLRKLNGIDIKGKIILLDVTSKEMGRLFQEGASAIIVVGEDKATRYNVTHNFTTMPVNLPRAYISRKDAESQGLLVKNSTSQAASLEIKSQWKSVVAKNVYVYIKAKSPKAFKLEKPEVLVLSTGLDTFGMVPEMCKGYRKAANVALLSTLAVQLKDADLSRDLCIIFWGSHYAAQDGARNFFYITSDVQGRLKLDPDVSLLKRKPFYDDELIRIDSRKKVLAKPEDFFKLGDSLQGEEKKDHFKIYSEMKMQMGNKVSELYKKLHNLKKYDAANANYEKIETALVTERRQWNTLREDFHYRKISEQSKTIYASMIELIHAKLLRRETEVKRMIEHHKSNEILGAFFAKNIIALQLNIDLSDVNKPWYPDNDGANLAGLGSAGKGLFMQVLEAFYLSIKSIKDPFLKPYKNAFYGQFPSRNLNGPISELIPSVAGMNAGYNMFELWTIGDPRNSDEMPEQKHLSLSSGTAYMGKLITTLAQTPKISLSSSSKVTHIRKTFCYTYRDFSFSGNKMFNLRPGSSELEGPAAGAFFTLGERYGEGSGRGTVRIGAMTTAIARVNEEGYTYMPLMTETWGTKMSSIGFSETGLIDRISSEDDWTGSRLHKVYNLTYYSNLYPNSYDFQQEVKVFSGKSDSPFPFSRTFRGDNWTVAFVNKDQDVKIQDNGVLVLGSSGIEGVSDKQLAARGKGVESNHESILAMNIVGQSAQDYVALNDFRVKKLREKNIINDSIESLHLAAKQYLKVAETQRSQKNMGPSRANEAASVILSSRTYGPLKGITNDMIKAVVVLLILSLPFAFALERLLLGCVSIYRQLLGFFAFFSVTFILLYFCHPAFSMAASPVMILLAFCIVLMSGFVIYLVMGKFKKELTIMQGLDSKAHSVQKDSSTEVAAILIGIAGMRNRPLKTFLISLTIVLLTFTILAFSSFTNKLGVVDTYLGKGNGVNRIEALRQSYLDFPEEIIDMISELYGDDYEIAYRSSVFSSPLGGKVQREFSVFNFKNQKQISIKGILGFSDVEYKKDSRLQKLLPELKKEINGHPVLYFADSIIKDLELVAGDKLNLNGTTFIVGGTFSTALLQNMNYIDNSAILVPDFQATMAQLGGNINNAEALSDLDPSMFVWADPGLTAITATQTLLKHDGFINNITLYPKSDSQDIEKDGFNLAQLINEPVFTKNSLGAKKFFFTTELTGAGFSQVLVPLLLGALIIFSSLMGSIVDREREIFTYSALGLDPPDVAMLFFAESAV
ncbi:MAG: hypothetical protein HRT89_23525, partial [Lentisphaeria bacterium]|nr:hypothetical protein [Lentisphaeria bacterium]NQZ71032.1 hypothetical protein [Lentisphaeria bacterium]